MIDLKRLLPAAALVLALAACGGGGGSPGRAAGTTNAAGTAATNDTSASAAPAGSGPAAATPKVLLEIQDAGGTAVQHIAVSGAYSLKATVLDAAGAPVADRRVAFSASETGLVLISPTTALTDAQGVARVDLRPAGVSASGAATVTASAQIEGAPVSGQKDIGISPGNLRLADFQAASSRMASAGNTRLSLRVLVDGQPASATPINVNFAASCGRINGSNTGFTVTTHGAGLALADYTALDADGTPCSDTVTLSAASAGASPVALQVTVAPPLANAVTFVSAAPSQVFVAGSGGLEQSTLTFKVLSGTAPLAGAAVDFDFAGSNNAVGARLAATSGVSNQQGEVTVNVSSGSSPGPVKVRASLASDPAVFTETQYLTVASGPPSQRFMSLSVQSYSIEGWSIDGITTRLTARLADRQGNAVADGTVVNFTAEGGQVGYSCATTTVNNISSCSVDFQSQNPRPADGRVSVLAFTSGTKDYLDANGNNRFDAGDTLQDVGDAYRDDNEDGAFNPGEFNIPRGGTAPCAGSGSPFPARADTCDGALVGTVREQSVILFASSESVLVFDRTLTSSSRIRFSVASRDHPLLPMPAGTRVDAVPAGGGCTVLRQSRTVVPNVQPGTDPAASLATWHDIFLKDCVSGDTVIITVTSPSGLSTPHTVSLP